MAYFRNKRGDGKDSLSSDWATLRAPYGSHQSHQFTRNSEVVGSDGEGVFDEINTHWTPAMRWIVYILVPTRLQVTTETSLSITVFKTSPLIQKQTKIIKICLAQNAVTISIPRTCQECPTQSTLSASFTKDIYNSDKTSLSFRTSLPTSLQEVVNLKKMVPYIKGGKWLMCLFSWTKVQGKSLDSSPNTIGNWRDVIHAGSFSAQEHFSSLEISSMSALWIDYSLFWQSFLHWYNSIRWHMLTIYISA